MLADAPLDRELTHLIPFIVGISGHMKLPEDPAKLEALRERFRTFYRWLRADTTEHFDGLGCGLGLKKTPVQLLSSLAPGVDQIAAEVAREDEFGFRVVAPFPFPKEQYRSSSTFTTASEREKAALDILPHDHFYVELAAEVPMSETEAAEAREKSLTGDEGRAWRYAHLRASGEYVASFCDLLLVVTDLTGAESKKVAEPPSFDPDHLYDPGTPAIVEVRQHGVTPGLLPVESALPWADVGPVVYLPWQKRSQDAPSGEGRFAFYVEIPASPLEEDAQREVVQEMAELIEGFNVKASNESSADAEMRSMVGLEKTESVPEMPDLLRQNLLRIAGGRQLAKNLTRACEKKVTRLRSQFLSLGLAAAILLILFTDWEPVNPAIPWVQHLRSLAYAAAFACAAVSLWKFRQFRKGRVEADQIDSRCIAEGLRVQFYWTAAGTGVSVASNYLLRQRGAIRWIVNAVSAASSPYEPPMKAFRAMTLRDRCELLNKAVFGWIEAGGKKGQIDYNRSSLDRIQNERNHSQWQALTALFAGFLLSILLFFEHAGWLPLGDLLIRMQDAIGRDGGYLVIFFGFVILAGAARYFSTFDSTLHHPWRLEAGMTSQIADLVDEQGPLRPTVRLEWQSNLLLWTKSLLCALLVSGVIVLTALGAVITGADFFPSGAKLLMIAKNILFVLSARAALSSRLNFHTENFRNYTAMLSQFESGAKQLRRHLATLKTRCDTLSGEGQSDATADPTGEAERAITAIQDLILALGREALSEHAEWLHLRRDRPVSPNLPAA
jgi:hypothetical protein